MPLKRSKPLSNQQLLTALSHPTRGYLLKRLSERSHTPKDLAKELGCQIRHIEYHLGVLKKLGCIRLVKTERTPGGRVIGHHYRAEEWLWFDRKTWEGIDPKDRPTITMSLLHAMNEDLTGALLRGTIDKGGNHISRTMVALDETGYEQLLDLLAESLNRIVAIEAESAGRLEDKEAPIKTNVHIVQFISSDPE